jgi:MFS family permease
MPATVGEAPQDAGARRAKIKQVVIASSCNFLEMYDFMVFGYYATWIAKAYFPATSEFASLMLSLATFGAGFLMRPVGAIVLGAYIDRYGRRSGLLLALGLMAIGTLSIACMPGYRSIGLAAPILVVIGRLLQGLSAGAGVGGVSVYLSEIATPGNRGFYVAWQSASQQVSVVLASLVGIVVGLFLPSEAMAQWGWRIPFLVGCLLIPVLFWMQRSFEETPAFLNRVDRPETSEIFRSLAANWRIVGLGAILATMTTVSFYLITAYTPTYGASVLHLAVRGSLTVALCVGVSNFVMLPLMGALSDRIGRRPLLIGCSIAAVLTGYPAVLWLVSAPSFGRLLGVELWLSLMYAGYNGSMVVFLAEIMPLKVRTLGFSLAYSLATAIFGGFTPAICTYLIHATGNKAAPGLWLSAAAICGLVATLLLSRRRVQAGGRVGVPAAQSSKAAIEFEAE